MNAIAVIKQALGTTQHMLKWSLGDLTDADLLVRPVPGANHIAWQIGHLIVAQGSYFLGQIPGSKPVELPDGFAKAHDKEAAKSDSPTGFRTKQEYIDLFDKVHAATLAALDNITDADLDKATTGPLASFAPTLGALLNIASNHVAMHNGQFTVVRRKLGKPILF